MITNHEIDTVVGLHKLGFNNVEIEDLMKLAHRSQYYNNVQADRELTPVQDAKSYNIDSKVYNLVNEHNNKYSTNYQVSLQGDPRGAPIIILYNDGHEINRELRVPGI
jgi:hypothetical protein